jgi:hypothetical protein
MIGRRLGLAFAAAAAAAGRADARAIHVDKVNVLEAPADFPARAGSAFVLLIAIVGRPEGATVKLREVWRPPTPGARDPASGQTHLDFVSEVAVKLGENVRRSFVFDQAWKIVPGRWQVEYWDGVRKMQSRSFHVYSG